MKLAELGGDLPIKFGILTSSSFSLQIAELDTLNNSRGNAIAGGRFSGVY